MSRNAYRAVDDAGHWHGFWDRAAETPDVRSHELTWSRGGPRCVGICWRAAKARCRPLLSPQRAGVPQTLPLRGPGIAVREVVVKPSHQRIDRPLYVDKAVGGLPRIWSKGVAEMKRLGSLCSL
jgi:hypothetical protein